MKRELLGISNWNSFITLTVILALLPIFHTHVKIYSVL